MALRVSQSAHLANTLSHQLWTAFCFVLFVVFFFRAQRPKIDAESPPPPAIAKKRNEKKTEARERSRADWRALEDLPKSFQKRRSLQIRYGKHGVEGQSIVQRSIENQCDICVSMPLHRSARICKFMQITWAQNGVTQ